MLDPKQIARLLKENSGELVTLTPAEFVRLPDWEIRLLNLGTLDDGYDEEGENNPFIVSIEDAAKMAADPTAPSPDVEYPIKSIHDMPDDDEFGSSPILSSFWWTIGQLDEQNRRVAILYILTMARMNSARAIAGSPMECGMEHALHALFGADKEIWEAYLAAYGDMELAWKASDYYIADGNWVRTMMELFPEKIDWVKIIKTIVDVELPGRVLTDEIQQMLIQTGQAPPSMSGQEPDEILP